MEIPPRFTRGQFGRKCIACKVFHFVGPIQIFQESHENLYQRLGKPYRRNELPLHLARALQTFKKLVVDFIGPINPLVKHSKVRHIIIMTSYLTKWFEATYEGFPYGYYS